MKHKSHIFLLLFLFSVSVSFTQDYSNIQFIENKGQWDKKVKFMGEVPGGALFIHEDGFTVLQHNSEDLGAMLDEVLGHQHGNQRGHASRGNLILRSHSYTVKFLGANNHTQIEADKPLYTYNNYFIGNDPSNWAANCKIYQGITIKNIYPNIDIRFYSDNGKTKYDWIVKSGGDVSKIALKYDGIQKLSVKNKELLIPTSVGEMKELAPYSYQYSNKEKKEVAARFDVTGNVVRFNIKDYDKTQTLVIDPTLIFCSFSKSTANNWGFTATYGLDGSMYGGGIVWSNGFPVSPGAFQQTYGGGISTPPVDIGIIKLTPDGSNRVYATYIGGAQNEQPHSLVVDAGGNLILAGRTNSANYPSTGSFVGSPGGWEIVVTKLNATGTALIGSRVYGGKSDDGVNINPSRSGSNSLQQNYGDDGRSEVIIDGGGNIYVASCTQSDSLPTPNSFQQFKKAEQDGIILKFSPDVSSLLFASYLGADGNDAAYVLALHPNGNIYVGGGTSSTNFPGISGGVINGSNQGGIDGFITIITNNGSLVKSTYVGTGGIDQVYGVQFDRFGFPYIMGQTTGSWPIINAPWSQNGGKQFIAKLQPDLSSYVYSTVFGKGQSNPDISPVAFLVDRCQNVYISGWGGKIGSTSYPSAGTTGLLTTPDALQSSTDGGDFYFFVLKRDAVAPLYASFFGKNSYSGSNGLPDHVDGGTSRFDRNGVIYQAMCADCDKSVGGRFPTTGGSWAPDNPSIQCNLAMVKIEFNLAGVGSSVRSSIDGIVRDTAGCVPLTVDFIDTLDLGVSYEWDFGDGSPQEKTKTASNSHTYTAVGTYKVMLVAIDSTTCNIRDTSYMTIKVGDLKAQLDFSWVKLDPCTAFKYEFTNSSVAPPSRPFTNQSFKWDFGDGSSTITTGTANVQHSYANPGIYNVKLILIDSGYCNSPDTLVKQLRVAENVKAGFETPPAGCVPHAAVFENTSEGGQQFIWDFGDGSTSNVPSPTHLYPSAGVYTVTLIAIDSGTCNITDSTSFTITVVDKPVAEFSAAPQPPVENTPIVFTNLSSPEAVRFKWFFGDGDSLVTASRSPVSHEYNSTGTFDACLIAYNIAGCSDTVCHEVTTLISPAIDVPNAFTPLSADANNKIFVRGFGIAKLKFIIWNRWGQKVFETADKRIGWDGRYKGAVQPIEVYAYTLEAEFFDGTKVSKKGDITLIR